MQCEPAPANSSGFFLIVWPVVSVEATSTHSFKGIGQRQSSDLLDVDDVLDAMVWGKDGSTLVFLLPSAQSVLRA